jgi:hypothetical protein
MTETATRDGERIIAEFPKNGRETVRVAVGIFNGHRLCNVRSWVPSHDGQLIPTKSGIALRVDVLPRLVEALQEAIASEQNAS